MSARPQTLDRQLTRTLLRTMLGALLLSSLLLLVWEDRQTRVERVADLRTQADILAYALVPALAFDDRDAATQQLASLRQRRDVRSAELYGRDGRLFAHHRSESEDARAAPPREPPASPDGRFDASVLELSHAVVSQGERLGTIVLRADHDVAGRVAAAASIQGIAIVGALAVALVLFRRTRRAVTEPIEDVARVAREVVEQRDWKLRAPPSDIAEIAVLVDSFNRMLAEVQARTDDVEREMGERLRAEADLRRADRRKDEFLATLAHELRNPLAPMTHATALLRLPQVTEEVRGKALGMLERQLRQMVRMIDDLLDISRITRGKLLLHTEPLDVLAVLRSAVEATEPLAQAGGLVLTLESDAQACASVGDPARLLQIFSNLLTNACRYTPRGGRIDVRAACDDDAVTVEVRDTGIGIDPAMQGRIFDLFEQVDKSLERGNAGLGIGLTLAREFVRLHGGEIAVHSEGEGRGACFTVRLPIAKGAAAPPAPPVRAQAAPADVPRRILLADDNVDLVDGLQQVLRTLGHSVRVVHDGQAAIDAVRAERPEVAVLDIGMPRVNGYEVARRLRAEAETRDLTLIAVTGWGQAADRQRARDAGFDGFLVKPVGHEPLLELIESLSPAAGTPNARAPALPAPSAAADRS
ncbi:MAG TPA: ATP-binding protein [Burkholderiaceae bacterium]|nr:ATP-binding protein [Burkholderiaceae bacterium]